MIDKLFPTLYVQGYIAALMDVIKTFTDIDYELKLHKRKRNAKTYLDIVNFMLENRAVLREDPDAFVRCNDKAPGGYEIVFDGAGSDGY